VFDPFGSNAPTQARCACRRNSSKRSINWPRRSSAMPSARWRSSRLDLVLGGEFDLLQELG